MKIITLLIIKVLIIGISLVSNAQTPTYVYDQEGRLIADKSEEIASIQWNNQSKIVKLTRTNGSIKPDLEFAYDASGNRSIKIVKPRSQSGIEPEDKWHYTYYEHDLDGLPMAIYAKSYERRSGGEYVARVEKISGAINGMGMVEEMKEIVRQTFTASIGTDGRFTNVENVGVVSSSWDNQTNTEKGLKQFELTNHLGDVVVVVNDRKLMDEASIRQATDFYSFGMAMPDRDVRMSNNYRYGFNRAEREDEVRGENSSYNFPGRSIYDPRLARFVSVDPLWRSFVPVSPYAFSNNSPLFFSDQSGESPGPYKEYVRMNRFAADLRTFSQKMDREGLDAFKTKGWINENTTNKEKFVYGAIDQVINELKLLSPAEWKEAVVALYEIANGLATGDISSQDLVDGIVNAAGDGLDHARASIDPDDPEFYYKTGQNVVVGMTVVAGAARKVMSLVRALRKSACFVGETEILTAGNKFVYIKDISTEEELYQLSEEEIRLLEEERDALEFVVEIEVTDIKFVVEEDQLFIVDGEWIKAIDLSSGDHLLKLDGSTVEIIMIKKIKKRELLQQVNAEK